MELHGIRIWQLNDGVFLCSTAGIKGKNTGQTDGRVDNVLHHNVRPTSV